MADSVGRVFALESLLLHGGRCRYEKPRAGVRPGIVTRGIFLSRKMLCFFFAAAFSRSLLPNLVLRNRARVRSNVTYPTSRWGMLHLGAQEG